MEAQSSHRYTPRFTDAHLHNSSEQSAQQDDSAGLSGEYFRKPDIDNSKYIYLFSFDKSAFFRRCSGDLADTIHALVTALSGHYFKTNRVPIMQ